MRQVRVFATAVAVFFVVFNARAAGQSYDLIPLGGDGSLRAYAVNATGQSVGVAVTEATTHAVRWQNEVFTDLHETVHFRLKHPEIFNDDYSEAYGISDGGQIVGGAQKVIQCLNVTGDITVMHGFLLRPSVLSDFGTPVPGDALTDLSTLTGDWCANLDSAAIAISNRNHIVGWSDVNVSTAIHAFLIIPVNGQIGGVMTDLLTLDDTADPVSSASAVNDSGQITGYAYTSHGPNGETGFHAFLITPTDTNADGVGDTWVTVTTPGINDLMQDLGTLGGTNSWGRDINNSGQVVGESDANINGNHVTHAFLWENGVMTDLGTLGGDNSSAASINDNGDIVGWSEDANGHRHAFLYSAGKMEDLNDKLVLWDPNGDPIAQTVLLSEARSINNDGFVIGWGTAPTDPSGPTKAFMLHPTAAVAPPVEPTNPSPNGDATDATNSGTGGIPVGGTWQTPLDGTTAGTVVEGQTDTGTTPSTSTGLCGAGASGFMPMTMGALLLLQRRRR